MRVERRGSSLFLYRSRRVGGRTKKEYLGPVDEATAEVLFRKLERERARQRAERAKVEEACQRATDLLAAGAEFDRLADNVFKVLMRLLGFELHHRGEWRQRRGVPAMATARSLLRPSKRNLLRRSKRKPGLINPESPDAPLGRILEAGAAGDTSVLPAARKLFENRDHLLQRLGSVAWMAEDAIVALVAGTNVVVADAVRTKLRAQTENLLIDGDVKPAAAERPIAVRAAHNYVVVHALETMMAREPVGGPAAAALDKALGRAERRLLCSLKALATLRRLRLPTVNVGQVNVGAALQVNNSGKSPKASGGQVGESRIKSAKAALTS